MGLRGSNLYVLFFCFVVGFNLTLSAQSDFDKEAWDELRKDLNYNEESIDEEPSNSNAFLQGFFSTLFGEILLVAGIVLIASAIVFLIVIIVRNSKKIGSKSRRENVLLEEPELPDSNSTFEDLWSAFNQAKSNSDFRECIRLIHQICIKKLAENGLLEIHIEKTNWEYVTDLDNHKVATQFSRLTYIHEYIWYGGFSMDKKDFDAYEVEFKEFLKTDSFET